ncbi:MAG: hypothetical protein AB1Z98_24520 [Nannocystaceae bacterium]
MPTVTFESFDPTPYQRAPRGNVRGILSLARALAELAPRDESPTIDRTATALDQMIAEVEDGLTIRRRESAPTDPSDDLALDGSADALWAVVRNGLEALASFDHPGLEVVLAKHGKRSAVATAVHRGQQLAARARALSGRLLGTEGLAFTQRSYPEQAESMGEILRLIDQDGLADELDALLGPHLLVALRACQAEYEAMVEIRLSRDDRKSTDLARLRGRLQRAISRYCSAVLTLLDEDQPDTLTQVLTVLRPIDVYRAQGSSSRSTAATDEAPDDEAPQQEAAAEPG